MFGDMNLCAMQFMNAPDCCIHDSGLLHGTTSLHDGGNGFQSKMLQDDSFYTNFGHSDVHGPYGHGYYYENNPNFHDYVQADNDVFTSYDTHDGGRLSTNYYGHHYSPSGPTYGDSGGRDGYFSGSANYGLGRAEAAFPMVNTNVQERRKDDNYSSNRVPLISRAFQAADSSTVNGFPMFDQTKDDKKPKANVLTNIAFGPDPFDEDFLMDLFEMPDTDSARDARVKHLNKSGALPPVILEPPQKTQPIIAKASPSHILLTCHAITLAGIQSATSGDVQGKFFKENATANAEAVTPVGAYLLRNGLASLDKNGKGQILKQQLDQQKGSYVHIDVSSLMGQYHRDSMGRVIVEDGLARMLPQQFQQQQQELVNLFAHYYGRMELCSADDGSFTLQLPDDDEWVSTAQQLAHEFQRNDLKIDSAESTLLMI